MTRDRKNSLADRALMLQGCVRLSSVCRRLYGMYCG